MKLILSFIFSLFTFFAFCQTDTTKTINLDSIIVSVNRFEELKKELPIQIQRITKKEIEFQNAPNTADVLINSGNVFVQKSQGGGGSPVLRGFEASRILLVVDGIRMNNAIYRGGHLQNILRVDQAVLENMEIIFGPSSLIYGSDALGGVISLNTKRPNLNTKKISTYARYGTATQEVTGHIDLNLGYKKWANFTSVTFSSFGDITQGNWRNSNYPEFGKRNFYQQRESLVADIQVVNKNPNEQVGSGYKQIDFLEKIMFQPSENQRHILNVQYSQSSDVPRYDRLSELTSANVLRFAEWYYGPEKRFMGIYEYQLKKKKLFDDSSIKIAYQQLAESRNSRRWANDFLNVQKEAVNVLSLNADFVKHNENTSYFYGIEATQNTVNSTAYKTNIVGGNYNPQSPNATRYPDGGSKVNSASVYFSTKSAVLPNKLIANYGIRYSYNNLTSNFNDKTFFPFDYNQLIQNNGAFVGNAGITFLQQPNHKFALLFSNGFRVPNVDDLSKVFDSVTGQVVVPNPAIKPETSYNFEVNTEHAFATKISVGATLYYTIFDNVIVNRPFTLNGNTTTLYQAVVSKIYANQNAENARIMGGNVNINYVLSENCSFSTTYNFIKGRLTNEAKTPLDHIPPSHGKTRILYKKGGFQGEFFSLYNGWKRLKDYSPSGEDNLQYATSDGTPSWWTLNLRTSFTINKSFTLQAALENILDKNYRYFASGISAPGRNLIVTLRGTI